MDCTCGGRGIICNRQFLANHVQFDLTYTDCVSQTALVSAEPRTHAHPRLSIPALLILSASFGIFCGLFEAVGLILFQRINRQRWGAMVHVSTDIVWISPIVDTLLFVAVSLVLLLAARFFKLSRPIHTLIFALTFLTVYDGAILPERLYRIACALLAVGAATAVRRWTMRREEVLVAFFRKSLVWLTVIWLLAFTAVHFTDWLREHRELAALPEPEQGLPNVLFIVVDTLRADHLSAYGYARSTSPNLDHIARQGVLFRNAIAPCSWTLPSHASLLTGRYPLDHGMENIQPRPWFSWNWKSLRGYATLPEVLEQKGFRTAAFSANQIYFTTTVGLDRGFSRFEDYFQSPKDMFLRTLYGRELERAYFHRSEKSKFTRAIRRLGMTALVEHRKRADEVNRETLAWIDRDRARPFFAFLNYIDVHDARTIAWKDEVPAWGDANPIDQYDSAIKYVDAKVGELLQELQDRRLDRNILLVITSDHGESLEQHYFKAHGAALYREQIQVPLILEFSGHVPKAQQIGRPVSTSDIPATLMTLLGDRKSWLPGYDLGELWSDPGVQDQWPLPLSQLAQNEIDPQKEVRYLLPTAFDGRMNSVVDRQWHLIVHEVFGQQLYSWQDDPSELHNVIDARHAEGTVTEMQSAAARWQKSGNK